MRYKEIAKEKTVIFYSAVLALITYGYCAFNNTLTGDNWMAVFIAEVKNVLLLKVGRWLQVVIANVAYDRLFAPALTCFFLTACIILTSVLIARSLRYRSLQGKLIFSLAFLSFPFWIESMSFNMVRIAIGIALILSVSSSYLLISFFEKHDTTQLYKRHGILTMAGASVLLFLATSIYQTYLFFALIHLGLWFYIALNDENNTLTDFAKRLIYVGIAISMAVILYYISLKFTPVFTGHELRSGGKYGVDSLAEADQLAKNIPDTFRKVFGFWYLPQMLIPRLIKLIYLLFLLLVLIPTAFGFFDKKNVTFSALSALILLILIIIPWSMGFLREGIFTHRYNALTAVALLVAFVISRPVESFGSTWLRKTLIPLAALTILSNVYMLNAGFTALYLSNQRDLALSQEFLTRLHAFPEYDKSQNYHVNIYGSGTYRLQKRPFDVHEPDNVLKSYNVVNHGGIWDMVSAERIQYSFKLLGEQPNFKIKKYHRNKKFELNGIRQIKPWPNAQSVILDEDKRTIHLILE